MPVIREASIEHTNLAIVHVVLYSVCTSTTLYPVHVRVYVQYTCDCPLKDLLVVSKL